MDKQRYGFRQKVTETNLNDLQDYAETGIEAVASDIVVGGGAVKGMDVTPGTGFVANIAAGRARDANGARASILSAVTLDLSAYKPTTAGSEKWVTIMAYRQRQQSNPMVDPNGSTYYFQLTETTQLQVVVGTEAAAGTATVPARPTDGGVLLADVSLKQASSALAAGDISTARREVYTPVANLPATQITYGPAGGTGYATGTDQVQKGLDDVGARLENHKNASDPHPQYALDTDLNNYVPTSQKAAANGVATLGPDGLVPGSQLPGSATGSYIPTSQKAAANGVASLDASSKLVQDAKTVGGFSPTTTGGTAASSLAVTDANGAVGRAGTVGDGVGSWRSAQSTPGGTGANQLAVTDASGRVGDSNKLGGYGLTAAGTATASAVALTDANGRVGDANKVGGFATTAAGGTGASAAAITDTNGAVGRSNSVKGADATATFRSAGTAGGTEANSLAVTDGNGAIARANVVKAVDATLTFRSAGTAGGTEANSLAVTDANGGVGRTNALKDGAGTYRAATSPGGVTANSVAVTDANGAVGLANRILDAGTTPTARAASAPGAAAANTVPITDGNGAVGLAAKLLDGNTTPIARGATTPGGTAANSVAISDANGAVGAAGKVMDGNTTPVARSATVPGGNAANSVAITDANGRVGDSGKLGGYSLAVAGAATANSVALTDANGRVGDSNKLGGYALAAAGSATANAVALTDANGRVGDANKLSGLTPATPATATTVVQRDANGRAQMAAPAASGDIARIDEVWAAIEESLVVESALPVTGQEPTQIQGGIGTAVEFADGSTQAVVFTRRWPFANTNLRVELLAAMDTSVAGNVQLQISWQVNGGTATNVTCTVTNVASTTALVTIDPGQIIAAASVPQGSMVTITISRLGADAADTHTGKFRLYHTRLKRG